jgi:L,D-peptidoglycan transpeptidase YkuD (ErfK/YbiS/YcfS/YnhG family)
MRYAATPYALAAFIFASPIAAQTAVKSCPEPLASARRLALVTTDGFSTPQATMRLYERATPQSAWRPVSAAQPAQVGRTGIAWSHFFRAASQPGEPIKVEGDKRAPAGFFRLGKSFGFAMSIRPSYTRISEGITCVHDVSSPAYNTITTRAAVGNVVRGENMWRVPEYSRGLFVEYPTDARSRAGSCIFVHLQVAGKNGTGGCVALPPARLEALQDFSAQEFGKPGAVLAILPRSAVSRFAGCLPAN